MAILDIVPFGRRRQYTPPPAPADRERDPVGALQSDIDRAFENFWSMVTFPMTSSLAGEMFERRQPPDFQVDVMTSTSVSAQTASSSAPSVARTTPNAARACSFGNVATAGSNGSSRCRRGSTRTQRKRASRTGC